MKAYDFEYDQLRLSDKGFMICRFDSGGIDTILNGAEITFNTVSTMRGMKHELTSAEYEECLTATFQICKNLCDDRNIEISLEDTRDIMRWLNRKNFHKFRLLDDEYTGIYFEASFNVSKIEMDGKTVGFELEMFTNRPFALYDTVVHTIKNIKAGSTKSIFSKSDEEGYIYPDMVIEIDGDGTFEIYNDFEDRTMRIANCKRGEIITINYPLIESSLGEERETKIQNDFNWEFFRIASTFKNRLNEFTISLPCTIKIKYSPIIKVGI